LPCGIFEGPAAFDCFLQLGKLLVGLRAIHPVHPIASTPHRPLAEYAALGGRAAFAPPQAAPLPVRGILNQSGPQRVALDIPGDRGKVAVVLHGEAFVRPLIQVPAALAVAVAVPSPHVRGGQPLHEPAQFAVLSRPQQQVPVVSHQAVCQQPDRDLFQRRFQHAFEGSVVAFVVEQVAPVVAAVETVEDDATGGDSGLPRHDQTLPRDTDSVNICHYPLLFSKGAAIDAVAKFSCCLLPMWFGGNTPNPRDRQVSAVNCGQVCSWDACVGAATEPKKTIIGANFEVSAFLLHCCIEPDWNKW